MKRLLLLLLAVIALPTAVGGNTVTKISDTNSTSKESEEFTDTNPVTYQNSCCDFL